MRNAEIRRVFTPLNASTEGFPIRHPRLPPGLRATAAGELADGPPYSGTLRTVW
jgi:hypothetical protein